MNINYREIARLKQKEVSNRKIATLIFVSRNTVNKVVQIILSSQFSFQDVIEFNNEELEKFFQSKNYPTRSLEYTLPNYDKLSKELAKPGVTMQLLWEEYVDNCRLAKENFYQLTQFKRYFHEHLKKVQYTNIIKHKAGEKIQVDWAGSKARWIDPDTGELIYGYLFVGVLPFSGYTFAKVYPNMRMESWIEAHNEMFKYFDGVSKILVPDNLKTGVTKHTKNEVTLNKTYNDMAEHYGTVIIPTRVRKPKDKAAVENTVGNLTVQIIGRMRNFQFFSMDEYNQQLKIELDFFNNKKFQKKEGSRKSFFEDVERGALLPLPKFAYKMSNWKKAKVQSNSHISLKKSYYSVPHEYIGKEVQLKIIGRILEIYSLNGILLCSHQYIENKIGIYYTDANHMPANSSIHGEWNSNRYLNWAKRKGPSVYQVIYKLFTNSNVEQKCYKTAHSILKLAETYSQDRLEKACQYALSLYLVPNFKNIKSILSKNEDYCQEESKEIKMKEKYLRGADYYGKK